MKYIDSKGNKINTNTSQDRFLNFLYTSTPGRIILRPFIGKWFSSLSGIILSSNLSKYFIKYFIKSNKINMKEYEKKSYSSFNDFFTRKIKAHSRDFDNSEDCLISPCDGKLSVYEIDRNSVFKIKNTNYNIHSLLRNKKLSDKYLNGYAFIIRLCVDDYHRYSYIDNGTKSINYKLNGFYHTVNPVANEFFPVFVENTREYTVLNTENFGNVTQIEVGALMVGKITNLHQEYSFKKGEEKGYFEFGGSTVILFIEKDRIEKPIIYLSRTLNGYESIVKQGKTIANKKTKNL